jgi:hypothetical protein
MEWKCFHLWVPILDKPRVAMTFFNIFDLAFTTLKHILQM